jgi:hypothetical protein
MRGMYNGFHRSVIARIGERGISGKGGEEEGVGGDSTLHFHRKLTRIQEIVVCVKTKKQKTSKSGSCELANNFFL